VTIVERLDEQLAHQLLATPPDEFVAARNALVKQLKAEGERDQAAEVGAMRRPAWVDWALNVTATEHPADVERFADAAEAMRDAQRSAVTGRAGVDLRTAMIGLRDRTGELARRANAALTGHGRPAALPDITERLAEIATSDAFTEQLRAGLLLGEAGDDGGLGFGDVDTGDTARPRKPKPAKAPAPERKATVKAKAKTTASKPGAEPTTDRTFERRRLERDLKTAERVSHAATRDAERANTAVRHAKTGVDAATDAVTQAQSALERAQRRLQREENERDTARGKADAAADEMARLRRELEDLGD
jgi:hypothetical protein